MKKVLMILLIVSLVFYALVAKPNTTQQKMSRIRYAQYYQKANLSRFNVLSTLIGIRNYNQQQYYLNNSYYRNQNRGYVQVIVRNPGKNYFRFEFTNNSPSFKRSYVLFYNPKIEDDKNIEISDSKYLEFLDAVAKVMASYAIEYGSY